MVPARPTSELNFRIISKRLSIQYKVVILPPAKDLVEKDGTKNDLNRHVKY